MSLGDDNNGRGLPGSLAGFGIKQGVRVISKAILKEVPLMIFPANPLAAVTALKQGEDESSPLVSLIKWI
jgi:hypothetical protein